MMTPKPFRRQVKVERAPSGTPERFEAVQDRRVVLHPDGAVDEIEISERFCCECPRDSRQVGGRCSSCSRLFCIHCPNVGHTRSSELLCGRCSRLVQHADGAIERFSHAAFRRYRVRRCCRFCFRAVASLFVRLEDR